MFVGGVASGYQLYLAAMSPTPPLQDETVGAFLVVRVQHTYFFRWRISGITRLFQQVIM